MGQNNGRSESKDEVAYNELQSKLKEWDQTSNSQRLITTEYQLTRNSQVASAQINQSSYLLASIVLPSQFNQPNEDFMEQSFINQDADSRIQSMENDLNLRDIDMDPNEDDEFSMRNLERNSVDLNVPANEEYPLLHLVSIKSRKQILSPPIQSKKNPQNQTNYDLTQSSFPKGGIPLSQKLTSRGQVIQMPPPQFQESKKENISFFDDDQLAQRKVQLEKRKIKNQKILRENADLKLTREQLMNNVCKVLFRHITDAENLINSPTEAALLFHEFNFLMHEWNVYSARGYSSTMPLFYFNFQEVPYVEQQVQLEDIIKFMWNIMEKMQLATECIVISLIYIEKMMATSKIEIRNINWRPLLLTALLLAGKFWDDIAWWNIDFWDNIQLYPLKALNRMESEFLSLCDYNIYVSADMYINYQSQLKQLNNKLTGQQQVFNRFKQGARMNMHQDGAPIISKPTSLLFDSTDTHYRRLSGVQEAETQLQQDHNQITTYKW